MKYILNVLFAFLLALAVSACDRDGPAEEFGEKIDDTVDDIGDELEDACEIVKEGVNAEDTDCD
jgi:hypothetical protein